MLDSKSIIRYIKELNIAHVTSNKSYLKILNDFYLLNKRKGILWGEYFSFHFETKSDDPGLSKSQKVLYRSKK